MDISERLQVIINELFEGNKRKFAHTINIAPTTLSSYLSSQRSKPSSDVLESILNNVQQISPSWLLTGEGDMLISSSPSIENKEGIPLYRSEAAAGFGTAEFAIEEKDIEARYYIKELSSASFMLHVKGDSMMPTYKSGDIIAVRTISDRRQIQWGKPHLIAVKNNGLMVKRIYQDGDNIIATSDNNAFAPIVYHKSEVSGIAIVLGSVRIDQY